MNTILATIGLFLLFGLAVSLNFAGFPGWAALVAFLAILYSLLFRWILGNGGFWIWGGLSYKARRKKKVNSGFVRTYWQ